MHYVRAFKGRMSSIKIKRMLLTLRKLESNWRAGLFFFYFYNTLAVPIVDNEVLINGFLKI